MIARREHPEEPGKYVYVPLRMMEAGIWVPIGGERVFFLQALDAGMTCAEDLRRRYVEIAKQARVLRALCEHPQFAFTGDGVDSDMVRERAQELSRRVFFELDNVSRLLSEPIEDDDIVIGGVTFDVDEEEELIEPRHGDHRSWPPPGSAEASPPMPEMYERELDLSPELLLCAAGRYLGMAEQILGDARSSVEGFRNPEVAGSGAGPGAEGHGGQADESGASAPEVAEAEAALCGSPGFVLWAARSYIRLARRIIRNATASVGTLRRQMEGAGVGAVEGDEA